MAFLAAENENRQLKDLPQADLSRVPEGFLLSVKTKSLSEDFVYGKLRLLFVVVMLQRMFSSWALAPWRTLRFLLNVWRSFYFHLLIKLTCLVSKGLLCLYDKQNNTWLLVGMKFLFSCSIQHFSRSLRSLVSYRVKHSKRNSMFTRAHALFSVSL